MQFVRIPSLQFNALGRFCVMLPGAFQSPQTFIDEGFVASFQHQEPTFDVVLVDADAQYYLDQNFVSKFHEMMSDLMPVRQRPPPMLLGISMGGYGAIQYLMSHGNYFCTVLLVAPFLGERKTWLSIQTGGGLISWHHAGDTCSMDDSDLWAWLQNADNRKLLVLGYGKQDRFNRSHCLLAQTLHVDKVVDIDGGHDWVTWKQVLPAMLQAARSLECT